MPAFFKKLVSVLIAIHFIFNSCITAIADEPLNSRVISAEVQRIYVEEGVENVVLLCDKSKLDFHKEAEEFRDFRIKYGLLWTGIVVSIYYYLQSRR